MTQELPIFRDSSSANSGQKECKVQEGPNPSVRSISIKRYESNSATKQSSSQSLDDVVAIEEPLEIRLVFGGARTNASAQRQSTSLSITMRTPGDDFHLAMGFLVSEGIVTQAEEIESIQFCGPEVRPGESNIVKVTLDQNTSFSLEKVQRHFYTTSSCGICGKASLDAVHLAGLEPVTGQLKISADEILQLPERLREAQAIFQQTGGLHASGVFRADQSLECLCEDVGRHNALDKVLGRGLATGNLPWTNRILVVSGRASFE